MSSQGAGVVGMSLAGVLLCIASVWVLYESYNSGSALLAIGSLIGLAIGIALTVMGLKSS